MWKKRLLGCLLLVLPIALAFGVLCYASWDLFLQPIYDDYVHRTRFDSARWKAEPGDWANPVRLRMVDDLLGRHNLVGMSRAEVDGLLGVPQVTGYFSEYDYVYWLGPERRAFSIDSEWLAIKFKQDRVTKARVVRD